MSQQVLEQSAATKHNEVKARLEKKDAVHLWLTGNLRSDTKWRLRNLGLHVGEKAHCIGLWNVCFLDLGDPGCQSGDWCNGPFTMDSAAELRRYILSVIREQWHGLLMPSYFDCQWHDQCAVMRIENVPAYRLEEVELALSAVHRCEVLRGHSSISVVARTYSAHCRASNCLRSFGLTTTVHSWMPAYVKPDGMVLEF